jgi:hypothetical protein
MHSGCLYSKQETRLEDTDRISRQRIYIPAIGLTDVGWAGSILYGFGSRFRLVCEPLGDKRVIGRYFIIGEVGSRKDFTYSCFNVYSVARPLSPLRIPSRFPHYSAVETPTSLLLGFGWVAVA